MMNVPPDYDPVKFPAGFEPTAEMVAQFIMDDAFGDFDVTPVKASGKAARFYADLTGDTEYEVIVIRRARKPA